MLVVIGALSTPAVAQQRSAAWLFGLAATVGSGWQMESADIGVVRPVGLGPVRFLSINGRFGTFQDEGGFLFGNRGFVAALALGGQTSSAKLIEVGTEQNPIAIGFDLTLEAAGYLASDSPFPQGGAWLGLSVLPGVRTVQTENFGVSLMVGPSLFVGRETDVRALLAFRVEFPVGRAPVGP